MFILANYLTEEGKADRSKIAADIVLGKLRDIDINALIKDESIRSCFFGDWSKMSNLKQDVEWNEEYLQTLMGYNVSTIFNEEYLKYLYEVSQYLHMRLRPSNKDTHSISREHIVSPRVLDIDQYLSEGKVMRSKIVADIVMGHLNEEDVRSLARDETIKASFFGDGLTGIEYIDPNAIKLLDDEYLYKLMSYAVATSFNEEYMLYLCHVVSTLKQKSKQTNCIEQFIDFIKRLIQRFLDWINSIVGSNISLNMVDLHNS